MTAQTLCRLLFAPGKIARDFVLGQRSTNMHPLKLLVALVAALVLILAANRYFAHYEFAGENADVQRMAERVVAYANWSFSLGIFAIFMSSWVIFRRRLGYNATEHAVLAIYCQNAILALTIFNLLPTLVWNHAAFVVWHKAASQYYMFAIKLAIVGAGYRQFFLLHMASDWRKFLFACLLYAGLSWLFLRVYAATILWLVTSTM